MWLFLHQLEGERLQKPKHSTFSAPRDRESALWFVISPVSPSGGRDAGRGESFADDGDSLSSEEKQPLEENVFSAWREEAGTQPQRPSHGPGKRRLQQSFLPRRAAVGPG